MKTKPKLRARRMWANYYRNVRTLHKTRKMAAHCVAPGAIHEVIPVAVIPLDDLYALGDSMVAALTAIGVPPKQKKGGRK